MRINTLRKSLLIFLLVSIIIIGIIVIFVISEDESAPKTPDRVTQKLSSEFNTVNLKPNFNFSTVSLPETIDLPSTINVYEVKNDPFTEGEVEDIANNLGFNNVTPENIQGAIDGNIIFYAANNGSSLRIVPGKRLIDYKSGIQLADPLDINKNNQYYESLAIEYLRDNNLISKNEGIETKDVLKFNSVPSHLVNKDNPNLAQVVFNKIINGFPLISPTFQTGTISVYFNSNDEVMIVQMNNISDFKKVGNFPVKNDSEIKKSFKDQVVIVNLDEGLIDITLFSANDIGNINIKTIGLAYIQELDPTKNILQPILLLSGEATLTNGNVVKSVLYMPAIKNEFLKQY